MPTFHRQPEWQQSADRHTQLVDPVLTVRQLSRFELNLRQLVRIDHALVFSTPKGSYEAYLPPRRPTRAEVAANRYTAVYEVDMGVHPWTAELALPSDNDAFEFTAEVDLSWQVVDPARFVASGHRDVPGLILGELQQAARPVTRRFAITDSAAAEQELLQAVTVLGPLGAPAGLQVTWTLRIKRDKANIEHQQRLQAIDHSAAQQIRATQRGMDVDAEADRRHRQQDAFQIERAMAYGTQQQELMLQQQRWQHEQALLHSGQQHQLALQQGQQELELQQIEAQKIDFYQWHLQQGGVHAWALHLAQHPEDSRLVMSSMREDQLRMIQSQMELVRQLLNGDAAEGYELEGPKQLALRTVNDILTQRLPGVPQTPHPLPEGTGPAYPGTAEPSEAVDAAWQGGAPSDEVPGGPSYAPPMPTATPFPPPVPGAPSYTPPVPGAPSYTPPVQGVPPFPPPAPAAAPFTPPLPGTPPFPSPVPGAPQPWPAATPYGTDGAPGGAQQGAHGPQAPAWQPPPGYGTTPTMPDRPAPANPADATVPGGAEGPGNTEDPDDTRGTHPSGRPGGTGNGTGTGGT
ncbi:hypothetical protein [Streptomyces glomeratus]|uniref:PE-PGRS family protein n=1 Tax=Streptomyces glomeratus TaxID=284452 RepID=A0ABP6L5R8_9ACTN|nr:hypothetical protein [Streptomyces glomeratus]MCF1507417.1 hypothetical protein [Streptomyces glomeratus]